MFFKWVLDINVYYLNILYSQGKGGHFQVLVDSQFHGVRILHWVGAKRRPWASASAWLMVPDHFLLGLSVIKHKNECKYGIHAHVTGHFNGEDNNQESDFGGFPYFQTNPNDDSKIGWSLVLAKMEARP